MSKDTLAKQATDAAASIVDTATETLRKAKPLWRGWLHTGMAPLVLLGGLALMIFTPTVEGRAAAAVYMLTSLALFGNSAVYHRGHWSDRVEGVLRRIDHANIYLFIAGSYTPLAVQLLPDPLLLLTLIWILAAAGVTFRVLWLSAPRWLYTALYIAMGWVAVFWLFEFYRTGGALVVSLIVGGGLLYSLGAIVYGRKRPDPAPTIFGYHEIFHSFTVLAAFCHYAAIAIATFA